MLSVLLLLCGLQAALAEAVIDIDPATGLHRTYIQFPTILYVAPGDSWELRCKASPAGSTKVWVKSGVKVKFHLAKRPFDIVETKLASPYFWVHVIVRLPLPKRGEE